MPYSAWGSSKASGSIPAGPVTVGERERTGVKRILGGFLPGLAMLGRDVVRLLPGGKKPEILPKLPKAIRESFGHTVKDIRQLPALLPGGMKPSEMDFVKRARGSSYTEAALEDLLNVAAVAPIVGLASKGVGVAAEAGGLARTAEAAGKAAEIAKVAETPIRSAVRGVASGAEKAGFDTTGAALRTVANPIKTGREAAEAAYRADPGSAGIVPRLGGASMGRRTRAELIEAQRRVGGSQAEAAAGESVSFARTAATRWMDLSRKTGNPIKWADADALVYRAIDERVTGIGALKEQLAQTGRHGGPLEIPNDPALHEALDSAIEAHVRETQGRATQYGLTPEKGEVPAKAAAHYRRAMGKAQQLGRIEKRLTRVGERIPAAAQELRDVTRSAEPEGPVTRDAINAMVQAGRHLPNEREAPLLAQAAHTIQSPEAQAELAALRNQLSSTISRDVAERLTPVVEDLPASVAWGPQGEAIAKWVRERARNAPEAKTLEEEIASRTSLAGAAWGAPGELPTPPNAEALLGRAAAARGSVEGIHEAATAQRAVKGVERAAPIADEIATRRATPQMLPAMREQARVLRQELARTVEQDVHDRLLPVLEDLSPGAAWGDQGQSIARSVRQRALNTPEAQALKRELGAVEGNIADLDAALSGTRMQRGRRLGALEERVRGVARQAGTRSYTEGQQVGRQLEQAQGLEAAAEVPTFRQGRVIGRQEERVRSLMREAGQPTFEQGRRVERVAGRTRAFLGEGERLQRAYARTYQEGVDAAQKALTAAEAMTAPITAFPRLWRPLVQEIKRYRDPIEKMVKDEVLDRAAADSLLEGVPENLTTLMKWAADRGIDPQYMREFNPGEATALAAGAPRLGRGPYVPPGREMEAGARMSSTGARRRSGTMAESIQALQAAHVELAHEAETNGVSRYIKDTFAMPLDPDAITTGRAVPWSPTRPFGTLPKLTATESGLRVVKQAAPGAELMIPRQVADQLRKFSQELPHSPLMRAAETVLRPWRMALLTLSPRWYANNLVGNMLLATVAGGVGPADWANAWRALRVEERGGQKMRGINLAEAGLKHIPAESIPEQIPRTIVASSLRGEMGEGNKLTQGIQDYVRRRTGGKVSHISLARMNTVVDEFARTAVFMKELRKGASVESATRSAIKALVDYGDSSPMEREVMRKLIPFYSWQKGILKLVVKLPVDHPYRVAALAKVGELFGGYNSDDRLKNLPEYMIGSMPLEGGRLLSMRGANPFADSLSLVTPDGIVSSLSPVVETPIRALFNMPERGYFADRMDVGPIGFARPDITLWGQINPLSEGGVFRELPQIRAGADIVAGLRGRPSSAPGAGLQLLGATVRTPAQIATARARLAKGRAMAAASLLPPKPQGKAFSHF